MDGVPGIARVRLQSRRLLPRGGRDLMRQVALFGGFYVLYELVRAAVAARPLDPGARAFADARAVIWLERRLHVFAELPLQRWTLHHRWLIDACDWLYIDGHFLVTLGVLVFLYARRPGVFTPVRNGFMIAMALALVGYALFPTAPPRLMSGLGFVDTVRHLTGVDLEHGGLSGFVNLYAAVPSMHVCFALLTASPMASLARSRWVRLAWRAYPAAIAFAVLATGNHYLLDVALGALTAALATRLARRAEPAPQPAAALGGAAV